MGNCECGRLKGNPCGPLRLNTINVTMPGLKLPEFRTRCVMLEYAKYRNVPGHYGDAKWHKLLEAAAYEGVPTGGAHRTLADAQITLGLVRAVAR